MNKNILNKRTWFCLMMMFAIIVLSHDMVCAQIEPVVANRPPAPTLQPPTNAQAMDNPSDAGEKIILTWNRSADDLEPDELEALNRPAVVTGYAIERSSEVDFKWLPLGKAGTAKVGEKKVTFIDEDAKLGRKYRYRVMTLGKNNLRSEFSEETELVASKKQWIDTKNAWFGCGLLLVCGAMILFVALARAGYPMKIRKIAGLDVVEEAVGRATEMGKSCLFIPGIQDMNDIQTVAGMTVLGSVAKTAAEYDAEIEVPTCRSLVMTTAQETVEAAFLSAGRPDAYNAKNSSPMSV